MSLIGDYLKNPKKKQEVKNEIKTIAIEEYNNNKTEINNFINVKIKNSNSYRYIYLAMILLKEIIQKEFKNKYSDIFLKLEKGQIKTISEIKKEIENIGGANHEELRKN
jgi:hypothetical protein